MTSSEVYLDCAATTWVIDDVADAMLSAMTAAFGNPSSIHNKGLESERLLKEARESILSSLGVKNAGAAVAQASSTGEPEAYFIAEYPRLVFTSGGTEANNLAIIGGIEALSQGIPGSHREKRPDGKSRSETKERVHLITSRIEHPSVLEAFKEMERRGYPATYLAVDGEGVVDLGELREVLDSVNDSPVFASIMHVNNETGSIQPISEIASILRAHSRRTVFHVDAVQSLGKIPVSVLSANPDLISLSAHKIHGPKGIGALYLGSGVSVRPIVHGGGQEYGFRSGTENVPGIVGFGVAARLSARDVEDSYRHVERVKARFLELLGAGNTCGSQRGPFGDTGAVVVLNGGVPAGGRSSHYIANIAFPGLSGESIVHHLAAKGVFVSTQSACSSRRAFPSHVLQALGLDRRTIDGSIRVSFSKFTEMNEVERAAEILKEVVSQLSRFGRKGSQGHSGRR